MKSHSFKQSDLVSKIKTEQRAKTLMSKKKKKNERAFDSFRSFCHWIEK